MRTPFFKYCLLALAIIVWSAVFYKLYFEVNPHAVTSASKRAQEPQTIIVDSLLLNYRNPFPSAREPAKIAPASEQPLQPARIKITTQRKCSMPTKATYLGRLVQGTRTYSILEFPTGHFLLQRGDTMLGMKIIAIFEDSLKVRTCEGNSILIQSR